MSVNNIEEAISALEDERDQIAEEARVQVAQIEATIDVLRSFRKEWKR